MALLLLLILLLGNATRELIASWRIESRVLSTVETTDLLLVWLEQGCALASGLVCSCDESETVYVMVAEQRR